MTIRIPSFVVGLVVGVLWGGGVVALALTGNARFIPAVMALSLGAALYATDKRT